VAAAAYIVNPLSISQAVSIVNLNVIPDTKKAVRLLSAQFKTLVQKVDNFKLANSYCWLL
jgi:hypothetical protein